MTLAVHSNRIEVVAAHHPSTMAVPRRKIVESLPLSKNGRVIPEYTKLRLAEIAQERSVCGIVVSCPVQQDTGKLGYAAGRTLWTIERLLQDQGSSLPKNRPICLWNGVRADQPPIDEWGRCSAYAERTTKSCHLASQEQYYQNEGIVAARVWDDFMKTNWPDIYQYNPGPTSNLQAGAPVSSSSTTAFTDSSGRWEEEYHNDRSRLQGMAA